MPRPDPLFGEVGIVDEPHLGQTVEHVSADVVGVTPFRQLSGQLGPGASPRGEQAQAERPRLLLAG